MAYVPLVLRPAPVEPVRCALCRRWAEPAAVRPAPGTRVIYVRMPCDCPRGFFRAALSEADDAKIPFQPGETFREYTDPVVLR